jgi:hypothetical protein
LGPVHLNGRDSDPLSPTRSGLSDPEETYRLFHPVIEAAVPHPTTWRVDFEFDAYRTLSRESGPGVGSCPIGHGKADPAFPSGPLAR